MKNKLSYVSIFLLLISCSGTEPEISDVAPFEDPRASIDWASPALVGSITETGVGITRIPRDILESKITTSPPGWQSVYNFKQTIFYPSRVFPLRPIPAK